MEHYTYQTHRAWYMSSSTSTSIKITSYPHEIGHKFISTEYKNKTLSPNVNDLFSLMMLGCVEDYT